MNDNELAVTGMLLAIAIVVAFVAVLEGTELSEAKAAIEAGLHQQVVEGKKIWVKP